MSCATMTFGTNTVDPATWSVSSCDDFVFDFTTNFSVLATDASNVTISYQTEMTSPVLNYTCFPDCPSTNYILETYFTDTSGITNFNIAYNSNEIYTITPILNNSLYNEIKYTYISATNVTISSLNYYANITIDSLIYTIDLYSSESTDTDIITSWTVVCGANAGNDITFEPTIIDSSSFIKQYAEFPLFLIGIMSMLTGVINGASSEETQNQIQIGILCTQAAFYTDTVR